MRKFNYEMSKDYYNEIYNMFKSNIDYDLYGYPDKLKYHIYNILRYN